MVELPRNQVSELHFDKFRDPSTFQCWNTNFKTEVCSCSGYLTEAMLWIKEIEMAMSADDLTTLQSIKGNIFLNFEMLDAKIASALKWIISNPYVTRRVRLEDQKAQIHQRFRERQIDYMIHEHCRVTGAHEAVLHLTDLLSVSLQGDDTFKRGRLSLHAHGDFPRVGVG